MLNVFKTEVEESQKKELQRRIKKAKLARFSDLDTFDFKHSAGITRMQLEQLRELAWLYQMYNIILMGPSGTGKTYITGGLIRDAVMKGYKVQFIAMDQLVEILRMKNVSSSAMSAYKHQTKCNLVGIDDIMLMPMRKEEAVAFFNLVNILYENASLIITTNKAPTEWVEILQDEVFATALFDRILYHCDIIKLTGSSYRMENRRGFLNKETNNPESKQHDEAGK